jgi:signal transduction histidine kinase
LNLSSEGLLNFVPKAAKRVLLVFNKKRLLRYIMKSSPEIKDKLVNLITAEDAFDLLRVNESLRSEVLERKRMEKRLRKYQKELRLLTSELSLAEERKRRDIAYELHEKLGQGLAISKVKMGALIQKAEGNGFEQELIDVYKLIDEAITHARLLTRELSPPVLHQFGFPAAVEWLAEELKNRFGISIALEQNIAERLNLDLEVILFQIARELLINVVRHAKASLCKVSIAENEKSLKLTVKDNGRGFIYKPGNILKSNGYGIFGVTERIKHLGGCFKIESKKGVGTTVCVIVPKFRLRRKRPAKAGIP